MNNFEWELVFQPVSATVEQKKLLEVTTREWVYTWKMRYIHYWVCNLYNRIYNFREGILRVNQPLWVFDGNHQMQWYIYIYIDIFKVEMTSHSVLCQRLVSP